MGKFFNRKFVKIILFSLCTLLVLYSCNVKNEEFYMQETSKDSISNYLERKQAEKTSEINSQKVESNLQTNNDKTLATNNDNTKIEYDAYKKIDISDFIRNDGDNALIDHNADGIYLSDGPCKVTIKASVKIEKGTGLPETDINDAFATTVVFGPLTGDIHYADYDKNYFGNFHEIEFSEEFYNGRFGNGKIWFSDFGVIGCEGSSGYKTKYVSHNNTEYIGEVLTQDKTQTKVRVIIKDIYYKISKPTGTVTEWDLNKDFSLTNFYGTQCFVMRELEDGYQYILKPKFTYNVNSEYDERKTKYLEFFYTSENNTPEYCTRIMNDRESNFVPTYNKVGIGMQSTYWFKKSGGDPQDFDLKWDKENKAIIVNEKSGNNIATIKVEYIKEYKYKMPTENVTPGYKKYLLATKQANINMNTFTDTQKKNEAASKIFSNDIEKYFKEIEERKFNTGNMLKKTLEFGDYKLEYSYQTRTCGYIPNLETVIEKSVDAGVKSFFTEYYQHVDKNLDKTQLTCIVPSYNWDTVNNYMIYKFTHRDGYRIDVLLEIYIDLNELRYCYSGYWHYGSDNRNYDTNTKLHGIINRKITNSFEKSTHYNDWNSLGFSPVINDWYYRPYANIVSIDDAQIGDYVNFGRFYINRKGNSNSYTNMEWRVLDKTEDKMLIITRNAIDCTYAYSNKGDYSWENGKMRSWLNNEFINNSFIDDEKNRIVEDVDKVFLLSEDEARKYFANDDDRICIATPYARERFCWYSIVNGRCGSCRYVLRTLGYDYGEGENRIMYVNQLGEIITTGELQASDFGIRPAMWIKY